MKTQSFVPNSTQVPHLLLRHFMHLLKDTEFKCLMMICDQTYGWQREVDAIALSQFQYGITARDGTKVCCGTGASRPSIVDALKRLTDSGLVQAYKGNTNKYEINLDCDIELAQEYLGGKAPPVTFATSPAKPRVFFVKPTPQEVYEYCKERKNTVDPKKFYNYYESNGWKVGRNKMKDWKASVRTWESNQKDFAPQNRVHEIQKKAREIEEQEEKRRNIQTNKKMQKLSEDMRALASNKKV